MREWMGREVEGGVSRWRCMEYALQTDGRNIPWDSVHVVFGV